MRDRFCKNAVNESKRLNAKTLMKLSPLRTALSVKQFNFTLTNVNIIILARGLRFYNELYFDKLYCTNHNTLMMAAYSKLLGKQSSSLIC